MIDKNLVTKIDISGGSSALFEYNRMVHSHYLICLGCNKILTIGRCPLKSYEKALEQETNFSISSHNLHIFGYCPDAKEKTYRSNNAMTQMNEKTKRPNISTILTFILCAVVIIYLLFSVLRSIEHIDFSGFTIFNTVFMSILMQTLPFMLLA